jgi:hypothetical protein
MSGLGQNRKSSRGLGMSVVGGQAEVDLITRAAGRVSDAIGIDSPAPGNARTAPISVRDGPEYPQKDNVAPARISTVHSPDRRALCGPLRAPGSHRLLRGSADIPVPQLSSPTHWKTLSNKGPKLSARIRKNISVSVCDIRATCDLAESARLAHESSQLNPVPLMLIKAERFRNSHEGTE